ncbi:MAG: hypothetical protein HY088_01045, partial [Ignavibacteriales bacterium]|nr:hypothetical protein [Ignavibacteriales bacterium]
MAAEANDQGNTYQWLRNGVAVSGATASSYVISNASTADTGQYVVNVKNASVPLLTLQRAPYRVTLTSIPVADVPTLVFPATGATNVLETISLKWNRALDATAYTVQFGTDSLFTTTIMNDSTITDTLKQVGPLSFQTKHFWRVKARNTAGSSGYSPTFSFTVGKAVPFAPALLQPTNGSINQSLSPTLRWAKATRGQTYRVQASADPQFGSMFVNDSTLTDTLRQIGPLVNNLTVYWRVQSTNTDGTGPFSDVYSFTTSKLLPA